MTVIQTADGKLLRARPTGLNRLQGGLAGGFRPLWSSGDPYNQDTDGRLASYDYIYRTQPIISGVVDKLARRISTLPFDSYMEDGQDRELVRGDTLDTLIRKPMPRRATVHLLAHVAQSMLTHGNALVAKVRGNDPEAPTGDVVAVGLVARCRRMRSRAARSSGGQRPSSVTRNVF
jgi:hypothetical protein